MDDRRAQRVVEQHPARLFDVRDRRQPGRRHDGGEPPPEALVRNLERHTGKTTTLRVGSVPSLVVSTPSNSFSRMCTTLRSTAVIGSSSILLPDARVLSAGDDTVAGGGWENDVAEIYSPPYLFKGARPPMARTTCMPERSLKARSISSRPPG